jgi:flagellar motor switch/type III secretory pathway protein FliN
VSGVTVGYFFICCSVWESISDDISGIRERMRFLQEHSDPELRREKISELESRVAEMEQMKEVTLAGLELFKGGVAEKVRDLFGDSCLESVEETQEEIDLLKRIEGDASGEIATLKREIEELRLKNPFLLGWKRGKI